MGASLGTCKNYGHSPLSPLQTTVYEVYVSVIVRANAVFILLFLAEL